MTDPSTALQELLRQRGIVAYNGVVRPSPLTSPPLSQSAEAGSATSTTSSLSEATSGASPAVFASTLPSSTDELAQQASQDPKVLDQVDDATADGILEALLAAGGISAAAYAAYKLWRRQNKPASLMNAPNVNAISTLPSDPSTPPRSVVDGGELVPQQDLLSAMRDRQLRAPPPSVEDLSGPRPTTRAEVGARQSIQSRAQPSSRELIHLPDAMPDISDEQYRQAITLRDQIIADRVRGRRSNVRGRAGKPTAEINPEGVLNEIITLMRKNRGATGALRRVR